TGCESPRKAPATAPRRSNLSTARCCCGRRGCGGAGLTPLPAPPPPGAGRGGGGGAPPRPGTGPGGAAGGCPRRGGGGGPPGGGGGPGHPVGGGLGGRPRRYGLAANSVTAAELVTPGGDLVRADAGHESDLLWAVRGGGGVGVVTALEMRLYPVGELYAGDLFFPIGRAAEVLHAWRAWTPTAPDEVTSTCHLLRVPPLPEVPDPLRGRAFAILEAACLGDAGTGAELIGPLRRLGPALAPV